MPHPRKTADQKKEYPSSTSSGLGTHPFDQSGGMRQMPSPQHQLLASRPNAGGNQPGTSAVATTAGGQTEETPSASTVEYLGSETEGGSNYHYGRVGGVTKRAHFHSGKADYPGGWDYLDETQYPPKWIRGGDSCQKEKALLNLCTIGEGKQGSLSDPKLSHYGTGVAGGQAGDGIMGRVCPEEPKNEGAESNAAQPVKKAEQAKAPSKDDGKPKDKEEKPEPYRPGAFKKKQPK